METPKFYPKFEPNQVLSAKQLNDLVEYLEEQERLTRNTLIGVGILCGLELTLIPGEKPQVKISKGCGITTEGYLIALEDTVLTRYRDYKDPAKPKYSFFGDEDSQIPLWELLPDVAEEEDATIRPLTTDFLQKKAVILYLEIKEVDLETCTGDDCDDKGIQVELCVRTLLIGVDDLKKIIEKCGKKIPLLPRLPDLLPGRSGGLLSEISERRINRTNISRIGIFGGNPGEKMHAKFRLPDVSIRRDGSLLNRDKYTEFEDIFRFYERLIGLSLEEVQNAVRQSYETYRPVLQEKYNNNPFDGSVIEALFKQVVGKRPHVIQYFYDFIKDLILAYNEFKDAAFDLIAVCCFDKACFPRHLMLGEATGYNACEPSVLRHQFIPTPIYNGQALLLQKVFMLFERMVRLVENFQVPEDAQIKITPSKEKGTSLSVRAIPYYYHDIHEVWNYDLKRRCQSDRNLSYHAETYTNINHVSKSLFYNIDDYAFLRIEGHIERKCDEVLEELYKKIQDYNLPVHLIKLHLGKELVDEDVKLHCRFDDLELVYAALRGDSLCFLEKEIVFFSLLDYKKRGKAVEKIPGKITGTVIDPKGKIVQGAAVSIAPTLPYKATLGKEKTAVTDKEGKFTLDAPEGTYALSVIHPDYKTYTVAMPVTSQKTSMTEIPMEASARPLGVAAPEEVTKESGAGISFMKKPSGKETYKKGEFFDVMVPEEKLQNDSPGMVYLKYKESGYTGDLYEFIFQFLKDNPDITSKVDEIYYPALIIDKIDDIPILIPDTLTQFNIEILEDKNKILVTTAQNYKNQIIKNLADPKYTPTGKEDEILEHLEIIIGSCDMKRFQSLIAKYRERVREVQKLTLFSEFLRKHPGLEHKAGVPVGGTFIIVCDAGSRVVADFALPYICCSDCPPIAYIIPTKVIFKLPKTDFCKDDNKNYRFILEPQGGIVTGQGVSQDEGEYVFNPSKADAGAVKLTYTVNLNAYELLVNVIEIDANFTYLLDVPDTEGQKRIVEFAALTKDADEYKWNFGAFGTSSGMKTKCIFDTSDTTEFEVTLVVTKGECSGEKKLKITIPSCTAEFTYEITEIRNNVAVVQFTSEMLDAEAYAWDFAGISTSTLANPIWKFDVSERQSFEIRLTVTKGDCRDETMQTLTIIPCTAQFEYKEQAVTGNIARVAFQAHMLDAEYEWDFGDGTPSINRSSPIHDYILGRDEKPITVTLTVKKDNCSNSWKKTFTLPPEEEISVKIEGNEFCRGDKNEYIFTRSSQDISVKGYGVIRKDDGNFYFFPTKISDDEMKETAGKITFTYILSDGQSSIFTVKVYDPRAAFRVGEVHRPNPQANPNTYEVPLLNHSTGANRYAWRFEERIFSNREIPRLTIAGAKAEQTFKVTLAAITADCGDEAENKIVIPRPSEERERITIPVPGGTGGGGTVVIYAGEEVEIISDTAVGSFHLNRDLLNNLGELALFGSAFDDDASSYKATQEYLGSVLKELDDTSTKIKYVAGKKDGEIAGNITRLFEQTYTRISKLSGAGRAKESQFVFSTLLLIQTSQLFNLVGLQEKDLQENSPIETTFKELSKILSALKKIQIDINPDKQFAAILEAALESAAGKPLYSALLKSVNKVIL